MRSNSLISFLIIAAILTLTCCSTHKEEQAKRIDHSLFSGEEIYVGIYFGQGPVANYLSGTSVSKTIEVDGFTSYSIEYIKKKNPIAFVSFKKSITSGDHFLVQEALREFSANLSEAAKSYASTDENKAELMTIIKSSINQAELQSANSNSDFANQQAGSILITYRYVALIDQITWLVTTDIENAQLLATYNSQKGISEEIIVDLISTKLSV